MQATRTPRHTGLLRGQSRVPHPRKPLRVGSKCTRSVVTRASVEPYTLMVYTKPECPLCAGLERKVKACMDAARWQPESVLAVAELNVIDINIDPQLKAAFEMEVPVVTITRAEADMELELPRAAPRLSAAGVGKHLEKHITEMLNEL